MANDIINFDRFFLLQEIKMKYAMRNEQIGGKKTSHLSVYLCFPLQTEI